VRLGFALITDIHIVQVIRVHGFDVRDAGVPGAPRGTLGKAGRQDGKDMDVWPRRAKVSRHEKRGTAVVRRLRGTATVRMSTDEIMALTRPG
jgi:hypothetical protein